MRPDLRTVSGVLALVVAVQACGDPQASAEAYSVSDSAGIHIIVNRLPLKPVGTWAVSHAPTVLVGSDESDEMHNLHRVAGAVVLSDDRIVVAHGPEPMLRWYSPDGEFLIGAGRPGGGPGEFGDGEGAWIYAVWPLEGDSVATWEHGPRRMQVFDPEGRYARYLVIDLPPDMPVGTIPRWQGVPRLASLRTCT